MNQLVSRRAAFEQSAQIAGPAGPLAVSEPGLPGAGVLRHVLLLQGPVGPFFAELQAALEAKGITTQRVLFNAADTLFCDKRRPAWRFTGGPAKWRRMLCDRLAARPVDAIVLFGANRPAHVVARHVAQERGIAVFCLEEGYLRSGFVTCERGGNNQHSPLRDWRPDRPRAAAQQPVDLAPAPVGPAGVAWGLSMRVWGLVYYLVRDMLSPPTDGFLFHRKRERTLDLIRHWVGHSLTRASAQVAEFGLRRRVIRRGDYILVPLQVSSDSQLHVAGRGWSTGRLIDGVLTALKTAAPGQRVVFKLHPLELGGARIRQQILQKARALGVDTRQITVLHTGRMGALARGADGMIVINSTSAFSALFRGCPLLVLGDAVFRHPSIASLGATEADIEAFFHNRAPRSRQNVARFLADLRADCLIAGDFYAAKGRRAAIRGIISKLRSHGQG